MPFRKGVSGNPAGRSRVVNPLRQQLVEHAPEAIAKLIELVRSGDIAAIKLLLERVLPALKPVAIAAPVPIGGDTLAEQGRSVIQALAIGNVTVDDAWRLLQGLGSIAQLKKATEQEEILLAVEQHLIDIGKLK